MMHFDAFFGLQFPTAQLYTKAEVMKMNEMLMAEDVLRPYGITLYYKGCEYLRDAIILHWHQPDLIPCQLIQLVANQKGVKKSSVLGTISTIANVAWKVNGTGGENRCLP